MANDLPFEIANFNLVNFAEVYSDITSTEEKTVDVQYKDANGNIHTKTINSYGKLKKNMWDDVGGALGQFDRVLYIDTDNGNDNNTGASGSPFLTFKKAIDAVPIGGYGRIYISGNSDVIITDTFIILNKIIEIEGTSNFHATIKNRAYDNNKTTGLNLKKTRLSLYNLIIETAHIDDSEEHYWNSGFINSESEFSEVIFNYCDIRLNNSDLIHQDNNNGFMSYLFYYKKDNYTVTQVGNKDAFLIKSYGGTFSLSCTNKILGKKADGSDITDIIDLTSGIVRDSNGNIKNALIYV